MMSSLYQTTSITYNVLLIDWPSAPPKHAIPAVTSTYPNISKVTHFHLRRFALSPPFILFLFTFSYSKDNLVLIHHDADAVLNRLTPAIDKTAVKILRSWGNINLEIAPSEKPLKNKIYINLLFVKHPILK